MNKIGYASVFAGASLFILLFIFSKEFIEGINKGLLTSINVIIPSLFPFMIAATLTGSGKLPRFIIRLLDPICNFLFGLPGSTALCIITSQLGGYLAGAKGAQSLFSNGIISRTQAERLLFFCVNSGVGFSVNAVGCAMLCSRQAGKVLFISLCVSSLITGFILKLTPADKTVLSLRENTPSSFSAVFTGSVSSCAKAALYTCGFTALASGIINITNAYIKNETLRIVAACLIEVTNGCAQLAGKASLPIIAAVCAFGGLCVHLQIFSLTQKIKINVPKFYFFRLFHCVSAYTVCKSITHFYPIESEVFLSFSENAAAFSFSAPAAISMLFLCILMIFDLDNSVKI